MSSGVVVTRPGPLVLVFMGVSGCGKSTVAALLAGRLGWPFEEGDALAVFACYVVALLGREVFELVGKPGERFLRGFNILVDALAHIDFIGLARHGFHFRRDGGHRLERVTARCPRRTNRLLRLLDFSDDHLDGRRDSRDQDADAPDLSKMTPKERASYVLKTQLGRPRPLTKGMSMPADDDR